MRNVCFLPQKVNKYKIRGVSYNNNNNNGNDNNKKHVLYLKSLLLIVN